MKKKILIIILSATALLIISGIILGIILTPDNSKPKTDTALSTSSEALPSTESSVTDTSEPTSDTSSNLSKPSDQPSSDDQYNDRAERITAAYEYRNDFTAPTFELKKYKDSVSNKTLPYWIYVPDNYDPQEKYPVLLYLHGAGDTGYGDDDPLMSLRTFAFSNSGDILRGAIIVVPQTPWSWDILSGSDSDTGWLAVAMRALFNVEKTYSCDLDRIYVTGISMGSFGTWNALAYYSDHFAAAAPICGGAAADMAHNFKHVPIWIFHGTADNVVPIFTSENVYNALIRYGSTKVKFSRLEGKDHNITEVVYRQRELWLWMFTKNKSTDTDASQSMYDFATVKNSKGRVLFNQTGLAGSTLTFNNEYPTLKVKFTDSAMKAIKAAYNQNNNEEFTLYIGRNKLFSFKFVYEPTDNSVYLIDVYSKNECYTLGPILSGIYS